MSTRLPTGGVLVDRNKPVRFSFNGKKMTGLEGDTLASALLAGNVRVVGRSFKYHRHRGIVGCGPEDPNGLMTLGTGNRLTPNQQATTTRLFEGLSARSQNHWPSLEFDLGGVVDKVSSLTPAGFYYKTFIQPRRAWKHVYEPLIRQAAGLGRPPRDRDPDLYEHFHAHVDLLVIGGGISGLIAASIAGRAGLRVLLLEQFWELGGRTPVDVEMLGDEAPRDWIAERVEELNALENVHLRCRTCAVGVYDHGYVLANERVGEGTGDEGELRNRLWRIRARKIILASGAIERPLCFVNNDVPGVMLASAVRDYVTNFGVSPGDRTVVVTNNDDAYRTVNCLVRAGLDVPMVVDARPVPGPVAAEAKELGVNVVSNRAIANVEGTKGITGVSVCSQAGEGTVLERLDCEVVAVSGGWSPAVHLWSHCSGRLRWDDTRAMFRPDRTRPPLASDGEEQMVVVGSANGMLQLDKVIADAAEGTVTAVRALGGDADPGFLPEVAVQSESPASPVWLMPNGMDLRTRAKAWIDFQNDVKVSDIELAVREGFESSEHVKRYTTLGMATDQGKTSNINGLAILARSLNTPIEQTGTTTFRPPYTAVPMGAIAGKARGSLFKPTRRTPMDAWHDANGAYWEPVGDWRRPYCYLQGEESVDEAVRRECLSVRRSAGIIDASTLGKILVSGPDAGRFLDMMYTNMMSTLRPGRCRYGLMCNDNGFLMDDGVVARLSDESFLCHTTTGGADHIHGWMEEWLQTEWWDWQVHVVNITEQFAQIGIAGPHARKLLSSLGGMNLGAEDLPFMCWIDGQLAGHDVRVFRISFSGELSFEVAVRGSEGLELWRKIIEAGQNFDAGVYGTEALHILRAEVGFIMIGDETDGTVTPQDLGLTWALSRKKEDFLGKRAQERSYLTSPDRWRLVGLLRVEGNTPLAHGAYAVSSENSEFGHTRMIGRVTSSYYSPILDRPIAMALVENGPEMQGTILEFVEKDGRVRAEIVDPVFYHPSAAARN